MHYSSMTSREREENGSQRGPKGGHMRQNEAKPKLQKASPKAPFAEQDRNSLEKGCEEDAKG